MLVAGSCSHKGSRDPPDLADYRGVVAPGHGRPRLLVRVVADELPGASAVLAGALQDEAVVGPHKEDAADPPPRAGVVDQDRAAVDGVGSIDSPGTWMTRQSPAARPWRASHSRRNFKRPVIRSWSTTAPPASSDTPT